MIKTQTGFYTPEVILKWYNFFALQKFSGFSLFVKMSNFFFFLTHKRLGEHYFAQFESTAQAKQEYQRLDRINE